MGGTARAANACEVPRRSLAESQMVTMEPRHPVVKAVSDYWNSKRGARSMPARADLDPCDIPGLLPNLLLIDVAHNPLDFRYRLVGTIVDYHLREPRTGQWMSSIPHQCAGSVIWSTLESVVTRKVPVASTIPYVGPHADYMLSEDIILPLSDDDVSVNMLLVAVAYVAKDER